MESKKKRYKHTYVHKTEIDTQIKKTNLWLPKVEGGGR